MKVKISQLYSYCEDIAGSLGLTVNDRFVFDLHDDTSVNSIEDTFKGIKSILQPINGRYLVLMVTNEKPNVLVSVFPETQSGGLKVVLFNVSDQSTLQVTDGLGTGDEPITLENFENFLNTDEVESKVNDFLFSGEKDEKDEKDDKEEDEEGDEEGDEEEQPEGDEEEITIEPDSEDDEGEEDEEDEVVVEPDDEEEKQPEEDEEKEEPADSTSEVPVDESKKVVKEGVPPADPVASAPDPAPAPEAEPAAPVTAPADPEKSIRDLIKHYTDELARVTADDTVSTDVVSGIQEIIAGLVSNLEALNSLKETEEDEAKAAAKATLNALKDNKKSEEPAGGEEVSEDGIPPSQEDVVGGEKVPVDHEVILDAPIPLPGEEERKLADVTLEPGDFEGDDTPVAPDPTVLDVGATPIITDAPVDPVSGVPLPTADDAAVDAQLNADKISFGSDGLPQGPQPSDAYIDDQIASLADGHEPVDPDRGMGAVKGDDAVAFVRGNNVINWCDCLYDDGKANMSDNDKTVPAALAELKEYATRLNETVTECGSVVNEVTIGRINKFCNLCATAYDTWHKIQDALTASSELCEALNRGNMTEGEMETEDFDSNMDNLADCEDKDQIQILKESANDFRQVQDYIKSIRKYL